MPKFESTSKYFRQKRLDSEITQAELARALGFSSAQIVSNWERGICAPPMASLRTLVKVLKLVPEEVANVITESNRKIILENLNGRKGPRSKSKDSRRRS
jgi:transcriptional regulator with XRE-family HTH domain